MSNTARTLEKPSWVLLLAEMRAVAEFGVDIALPQINGLHDMHLGVDQPEAVFRHCVSSCCAEVSSAASASKGAGSERCVLRDALGSRRHAPQDEGCW